MRKVMAFLHVSADGYFVGPNGDMSWSRHEQDPEYKAFGEENARRDSVLLFGRATYQMMAGWWPSPMAREQFPVMAERMNATPKVVFSCTLDEAAWSNTKLVKGDAIDAVRSMKKEDGLDMVILGSGSLIAHLAQAGLVDEFQLLITPVALGSGRTAFDGISRTELELASSRVFKNGKVLLTYKPQSLTFASTLSS
jgi:dihydrofolate reductase